jgi:NADPH-dependent 2,4-dienoyl-CoA reductase/sulfur reductase-like enzyme
MNNHAKELIVAGQDAAPGRHVVVVGASIAGTRCAQALRSAGLDGPITLIGAEAHLPYDRPPLSKGLLSGQWSDAAVHAVRLADADELRNDGIELRLGVSASRVDVAARVVELADGAAVSYDALVLATGAVARPAPWSASSGLCLLRTLDDARVLSDRLALGEPVVVVGGGFIGTEVAASARRRGCPVTVVDPVREPMTRLVGPDIADALVRLHHRYGTSTRFGTGVVAIDGHAGHLSVGLDDGSELAASTVVVGIGARPATEWLAGSGITVDGGVLCDGLLRARGAADVFAIGDVARYPHPGRQRTVRSEHWTNAVDQARHVAGVIVRDTSDQYAPTDYVWSDQYDWKVQSIGWQDAAGGSLRVGDLDPHGRAAVVFTDADGIVCGAVAVNWPKALLVCRRLLAQRAPAHAAVDQLRAVAA